MFYVVIIQSRIWGRFHFESYLFALVMEYEFIVWLEIFLCSVIYIFNIDFFLQLLWDIYFSYIMTWNMQIIQYLHILWWQFPYVCPQIFAKYRKFLYAIEFFWRIGFLYIEQQLLLLKMTAILQLLSKININSWN